jgi:CheY-like chemotaxis protein
MFRLLVIEDLDEIYEYYERVLINLLPKEKIEITRAATILDALELIQEPWDVILMDYAVGEPASIGGASVKHGADIIKVRRAVESQLAAGEGDPSTGATRYPPAFIIGTSSSTVTNEFLVKAGADASLLKNAVPEMAREIERRL